MRQHGEDGFARRALNAPDGEAAEANSSIMGVARETAAAGARGFVFKLKADREEKGQDKLDKCFGVVKKPKIGCLIVEVDGDGAVFAYRFGALSHVSPSVKLVVGADETS
jgi:hypothetical protein